MLKSLQSKAGFAARTRTRNLATSIPTHCPVMKKEFSRHQEVITAQYYWLPQKSPYAKSPKIVADDGTNYTMSRSWTDRCLLARRRCHVGVPRSFTPAAGHHSRAPLSTHQHNVAAQAYPSGNLCTCVKLSPRIWPMYTGTVAT